MVKLASAWWRSLILPGTLALALAAAGRAAQGAAAPAATSPSWIKRVLQAGTFADNAEKQKFVAFFDDYFQEWEKRPDKSGTAKTDFPDRRKDLWLFLRTGKIGDAQSPYGALLAVVLKKCAAIANGDFDPAARYYAMLTIGELNVSEIPTEPPVPLPSAVPVLVATLGDEQQIDSVRVAALVGLLRHAKLGGVKEPDQRKTVLSAAFKLLKEANPPAGRTAEGHTWMRAQAAEILGEFGIVGNNGAVAEALAALAADGKLPFSARCAAARALGRMTYQSIGSLDALNLGKALCQLAIDVCKTEEEQQIDPPQRRRRLRDRLGAVAAALSGPDEQHKGIAPIVTAAAQKQFVADVLAAVQPLLDLLDDKRPGSDEKIGEQLLDTRTKLEESLKKVAQ